MQRPVRTRSGRPPRAERKATPNSLRDLLAVLLALATVACLGAAFFLSKDAQPPQFLMPGPLASAHGAIENCSACHAKSGSDRSSWIQSVVTRDPLADSNACLTCHKMPDTAFNAHSASAEVLKQSTERLAKIAARTPAPQWARAQGAAFPTQGVVARGLYCATCHQEHQGTNFNLGKVSNEQCHSCHVVKFDSFDGHHPKFENYPFERRTRIIYDHAGHFGKHFPEVAKKEPARRVPATCSTCHDSSKDRRVMAVAPFERTCTACHLDQITGKERVSGPKGIAFLTLPGLDLRTLRERKAPIGEWPAGSEAQLTPFMKVMISRNARGRALIETVESLDLLDLSNASDAQIEAVTDLAWEIKRLFYALISGKASNVLGDLNIRCGAKLSASLVADLTASIPRDVVVSAHLQWLPNLGTEMANRPAPSDEGDGCWITTIGGWNTTIAESGLGVDGEASNNAPGAVAKNVGVDPFGRLKGRNDEAEAAKAEAAKAEKAKAEAAEPKRAAATPDAANAGPGKEALAAVEPPRVKAADQTDDLLNLTEEELRALEAQKSARPAGTAVKDYRAFAGADGGKGTLSADEQPRTIEPGIRGAQKIAQADGAGPARKAADQTDDLLNPTPEELEGSAAPAQGAEKAAPPPEGAAAKADTPSPEGDGAASADAASKAAANAPADAPAAAGTAVAEPKAKVVPVISIESDVDPESWAEYGGWYRQDYAIFYRPTGHKDKFIYSWFFLTGPQAPKGGKSPAAAVFDFLAGQDAQGACTKCHSVDDIQGKGRVINFSPPSVGSKLGRFTNFVHEPHFGVLKNRGCLTCHSLEKGRPYLQSYAQGNPKNFVSNFGVVEKDLCQSCHTGGMARQDCLLCHKYHVDGVITPIMNTKIPTE